MNSDGLVESFDRTALLLILSKGANDPTEARKILEALQVHIRIDPLTMKSRQAQIVALTSAAAAARTFLGGVTFECPLDVEPLFPWPGSQSLPAILESMGARMSMRTDDVPIIGIGKVDADLYPYVLGSTGGVARDAFASTFTGHFVPSAIYAGALAVGEVFQRRLYEIVGVGLGDARGMRRQLSLDLTLRSGGDHGSDDAAAFSLPGELWLIGAGNVGQALLFGLSLLPYADPWSVNLVIQDIDRVNTANLTTSILSHLEAVGNEKTRMVAAYLGERGFRPRLIEQRFGEWTGRCDADPSLAVCGVDNYPARRALEAPGFTSLLDIGLGGQPTDYTSFRMTTFPGPRSATSWYAAQAQPRPLDREMARRLSDDPESCGAVTLATSTAVGTPYVSMAVAAIALAQIIGRVTTGTWLDLLDHDVHALAPGVVNFNCPPLPPVHMTATSFALV